MIQALRILLYSWAVILTIALFIHFMSGDWNKIDHVLPINRILAAICLLGIIFWCFYEFGWLGGDKNNASHM